MNNGRRSLTDGRRCRGGRVFNMGRICNASGVRFLLMCLSGHSSDSTGLRVTADVMMHWCARPKARRGRRLLINTLHRSQLRSLELYPRARSLKLGATLTPPPALRKGGHNGCTSFIRKTASQFHEFVGASALRKGGFGTTIHLSGGLRILCQSKRSPSETLTFLQPSQHVLTSAKTDRPSRHHSFPPQALLPLRQLSQSFRLSRAVTLEPEPAITATSADIHLAVVHLARTCPPSQQHSSQSASRSSRWHQAEFQTRLP